MVPGIFLARPNRFIAHVEIDGKEEIVHVKNTGRCKELLTKGAKVWCQHWDNPNRKTKYDLIFVQKGQRLICMDSQAPNAAAKEWLLRGGLGQIENLKGEYTYENSSQKNSCSFTFGFNGNFPFICSFCQREGYTCNYRQRYEFISSDFG